MAEKSISFVFHFIYRVKFLNTNKEIVAMYCGPLNPAKDNDMLFIGSKTNLLVYGEFFAYYNFS